MNIIGISAYYHDSAAALVQDGKIVAAAQEERFTRKKHDPGFPLHAINYCLKEGKIGKSDIDIVAYYDKPILTFQRLLKTYLAFSPRGMWQYLEAMPVWIQQKLHIKKEIAKQLEGFRGEIKFCEHHESHAASAFYPSPFQESAIITLDGVGEWATTSYGTGRNHELEIIKELRFPHSVGLLYSAFTFYAGFKVNSGEYKLMGLAPYGEPKYADLILRELVDLKEDGSIRLNMKYFNYCTGFTMTNERFHDLFGGPPRKREARITQREVDIARSIQDVVETIVLKMARHVAKETGNKNLCMAGGVALNCVANGKLHRERVFERIWVQPASGDAGGAIGSALAVWHRALGKSRNVNGSDDLQNGSYLGPEYSEDEIEKYLNSKKIRYQKFDSGTIEEKTADLLAEGNIVGWHSGRMEFGPRALGGRSILGDPRGENMQSRMNLKIKFRESFRPFAPSVLREKVSEYFEYDAESPYMLMVAPVAALKRKEMTGEEKKLFGIDKLNIKRSEIPAVTHVDYSARLHTVDGRANPGYYRLLNAFYRKTGCPVLINTSFNVRGEPIVNTPEESYRCFMRTGMDYLVLGNCLIDKKEQSEYVEDGKWRDEFVLD